MYKGFYSKEEIVMGVSSLFGSDTFERWDIDIQMINDWREMGIFPLYSEVTPWKDELLIYTNAQWLKRNIIDIRGKKNGTSYKMKMETITSHYELGNHPYSAKRDSLWFHSDIAERKDRLGVNCLFRNFALVIGEVLWSRSHCLIEEYSYV